MGAKPGVVRAVVDNNRPKRVLCVHRETGGGSRTRWSWEGGGVQSRRQEHARVRDTQVARDRLKPENNARQQQPTLRLFPTLRPASTGIMRPVAKHAVALWATNIMQSD